MINFTEMSKVWVDDGPLRDNDNSFPQNISEKDYSKQYPGLGWAKFWVLALSYKLISYLVKA